MLRLKQFLFKFIRNNTTLICLLWCFLTAMCLPLVVTYDGHLYHELAAKVFNIDDWRSWDVVRTPIFPAALGFFFRLVDQPHNAVILLNVFFTLLGLFSVRLVIPGRSTEISIVIVLMSPLLITYQHMLLSECALLFSVALIIASLSSKSTWRPYYICFSFLLAYYIKPSFLYIIIPIVFFIVLMVFLRKIERLKCYVDWFCDINTKGLGYIFIAITLMIPWHLSILKSGRLSDVKGFFAVKHLIIQPEDISNTEARRQYSEIYHKHINSLPANGVPDHLIYPIVGLLTEVEKSTALAKSWTYNPGFTFKRTIKTINVYLSTNSEGENSGFGFAVLKSRDDSGSYIYPGPEHLSENVKKIYRTYPTESIISKFIIILIKPYTYLASASLLMLPFAFVFSQIKRDKFLFWGSFVCIIYLAVHAVALMNIDRYAFPVSILSLVIFVRFISLFSHTFMRRPSTI